LKEKQIMSSFERLFAGALLVAVMAMPAYAQTPPTKPVPSFTPSGTSAPTNAELAADAVVDPDALTDGEATDDDVTIEDSAILPSAGGHEASRAPSMDLDCEKRPEDCVEPLTSDSPGPTLSTTPSTR
jgi:hypothetical protein